MTFEEQDISLILNSVRFSAHKHRDQRRKGVDATPYINHPIEVAEMLWRTGEVRNTNTIVAAILHDTVEDTDTTLDEIESLFGPEVRCLVEEVTDDKSLPYADRKRMQIEHAPHLSRGAQQIKLADKTCNVHDVTFSPPPAWSLERRGEYLRWADRVVAGLRGCNPRLEENYDKVMKIARERFDEG